MVVHLFRKRHPTGFSIEKLFDLLHEHMQSSPLRAQPVARLELPHGTAGLWTVLKNAWYVRRHFRGRILHITGDVHYAALLMPFSPVIVTIHDCVVLQRGRGFKRWWLWLLWFRLPLWFASAVTVISEQTRRELLEVVNIPPDKVRIIPNFVSRGFQFSPKPFDNHLPRILHIGTRNNKNLPRVLAALHGLRIQLVIVGVLDAEQRDLIKHYRIQLEHHATPEDAQLIALYQSADLVSFPSTYEGFGMPILEAQAIGRPVLTSDMEPMRSVAGTNGAVLVDPLSVLAIRQGFKSIIESAELRDKLVQHGRGNVSHYTIDAVARQYSQLYEQLDS